MQILVLGATGMAGHVISIYLAEAGYNVTTLSRKPFKHCKNVIGDVTDLPFMEQLFATRNYDVIVNATGILNGAAEEQKSLSVMVNSFLPHFLSQCTLGKVIQMSTDCVFSGTTGSYNEDSFRDGDSFYDRTKALGELNNSKDLTFRNSIVGPDLNPDGIGLFNWFMMQNQETVKGYTRAIWSGVTTITLAKAIENAISCNLTGVYHLVNGTPICKFDLLNLFNKYFRGDSLTIVPDEVVSVDKSLLNTRTDFAFTVPSYETMIAEMSGWILNHKSLYPHYAGLRG